MSDLKPTIEEQVKQEILEDIKKESKEGTTNVEYDGECFFVRVTQDKENEGSDFIDCAIQKTAQLVDAKWDSAFAELKTRIDALEGIMKGNEVALIEARKSEMEKTAKKIFDEIEKLKFTSIIKPLDKENIEVGSDRNDYKLVTNEWRMEHIPPYEIEELKSKYLNEGDQSMKIKEKRELARIIKDIPRRDLSKGIIYLMNKYARGMCSETTFRNYLKVFANKEQGDQMGMCIDERPRCMKCMHKHSTSKSCKWCGCKKFHWVYKK